MAGRCQKMFDRHVRTLSNAVEHARGCVAINIGRFDMVVVVFVCVCICGCVCVAARA